MIYISVSLKKLKRPIPIPARIRKYNIVEIEAYSDSDSDSSAVGGSALGVTSNTDDEVEPKLLFSKILPRLLLFRKLNLLFIVVSETYLYIDEMMIIFSRRS